MNRSIAKALATLIVASGLLAPVSALATYQHYTLADLQGGFAGANQYGFYAVAKGRITSKQYLHNVCLDAACAIRGVTKYTWTVEDVWNGTPPTTFYDLGTDTQIFAEGYKLNVGQEVVLVLIPNSSQPGGAKALPKSAGTATSAGVEKVMTTTPVAEMSFVKNSQNGILPLQAGTYSGTYAGGDVNFVTGCDPQDNPNENAFMGPCESMVVTP